MHETRRQTIEVLDILEKEQAAEEGQGMSLEQIKKIFLKDRRSRETAEEADALFARILHLEESSQLNYYHMLPEENSLRMKVGNLIKRITRKIMRPIMLPIVDAQTRYNHEVKDILYRFYAREAALQDEQKALRHLLAAANRELKEKHLADE